jgi:hypothetical protein
LKEQYKFAFASLSSLIAGKASQIPFPIRSSSFLLVIFSNEKLTSAMVKRGGSGNRINEGKPEVLKILKRELAVIIEKGNY